ncbi:MAG: ribonuclease R [Pseudomonadota bacterium]
MARQKKKDVPLPTREQVLEFIRTSPTPVGKREIARAFQVKGGDRVELKAMLKDLAESGEIERGRKRRLGAPGALPEVAVLVIEGPDPDGDLLARPVSWPPDEAAPRIEVAPERRGAPALGPGDRILARLARTGADSYTAHLIRQLVGQPTRVVGIFERHPEGGGRLRPTDRRVKAEYRILPQHAGGAEPGELVAVEVLHTHRTGHLQGRVAERLGRFGEPRTISLIAIAEQEIPTRFSEAALAEAAAAQGVTLGTRTDLRDLPLVTIDGADARDFDDAVWAAPDENPNNPGGWQAVVAIADVAHYVPAGSALDRAARERGNSVYFPDRVVPMLPEALSNGWCSLKPKEDRGCLAVRMTFDARGRKLGHRFYRGLMRSAARLTYDQVQAAADGRSDDVTGPLMEPVIRPLYGAFRALLEDRERRGTLELDIPERRVVLDADGRILRIVPRERLDSHRLIEEFMIAANVAAAETLELKQQPVMYRVHDQPDPVKIEALRESLGGLGLHLAKGQVLRPKLFTDLLLRAKPTPYAAMVHDLVLRTQAQAVYSPQNLGHFGLALARYAHFTSPIRRYADLLVHRALINAHRFGEDGLPADAAAHFETLGQHISSTERRAAAAERDALDRYCAAFLADREGQVFAGRINGVTRFGLFVTLEESGANGLVPMGSLPNDWYDHDERAHALIGRRWGREYRLGEPVHLRLVETDPVTGGLLFHIVEAEAAEAPWERPPALAPGRPRHPGRPAGKKRGKPGPGGRPGRAKGAASASKSRPGARKAKRRGRRR